MGDRSGSFGLAEEEEAAALDGVAAGAREVGGSGDSAEEDEPVPEGAKGSFFRLEARSRLHVVVAGCRYLLEWRARLFGSKKFYPVGTFIDSSWASGRAWGPAFWPGRRCRSS